MSSNVHQMTPLLAQVRDDGPSIVDALRQVGMLVRVTCTAPGELKTDRRASEEADEAKKAKRGTGTMKVRMFNGVEEHKKVKKLQKEAVKALDHRSTPWGQDSQRLLPNGNFMDFIKPFTAIKEEIEEIVKSIETNAEDVCRRANAAKGDYDVEDLTPEDVIGVYSIAIEFQEIPPANFPGMPKEAQEWLSEQYAKRAEARYQEGIKLGFARLLEPLTNMVEGIDKFDTAKAKGKEEKSRGEGAFRDTLTENVKKAVDCLASFNLLDDEDLKEFTNSLILFQNIDADKLRKDSQLRAGVKTKAQETIERLRGMMA